MKILSTLKSDLLKSRKSQDKKKIIILSTVIGEVETLQSRDKTKEIKDSDVIRLIDKSIQALQERKELRPEDGTEIEYELNILEAYVPKKLTEDEIRKIKEDNGFSSARELMPFLKKNYDGLYDGRVASQIANE